MKFQRYQKVSVLAGVFGEVKAKIELDMHMIYWGKMPMRKTKGDGRVHDGSISMRKKGKEVSLGKIANFSAVE